MSDVELVEIDDDETGIIAASSLIKTIRELGLTVTVKARNNDAVRLDDGRVVAPGVRTVMISVDIPVPSSLAESQLTLVERCTRLTIVYSRRLDGRARGRWIMGNYSTLGDHSDMHTLRRCHFYLKIMAANAAHLARLADEAGCTSGS